jgi:hypothetical protein
MEDEKRRYARYIIKGRAVAILSPNNFIPYQILDISRNGLAFSYGSECWNDEVLELELLEGEKNFCLDKIPIRIISDCALDESSKDLRRCGVQFGELSPGQKAQLDYFIQKYTVGIA